MENGDAAIIVFTKDRLSTLRSTLSNLKGIGYQIIVLDDSVHEANRQVIKEECRFYGNVHYHGVNEQMELIGSIKVETNKIQYFTNQLGVKEWNLGYARNYAIILSKKLNFSKVLFMDDDIIINDKNLISSVFEKLDRYHFVGSKVIGMVDDSVTGHIVRQVGLEPEEYFSGGFIAFQTSVITEFFINQYNEDWIWMYLHNFGLTFCLLGEVVQQSFDPFQNGKDKAMTQEFGELLVDGVKESFQSKNISLLKEVDFWNRMIQERLDYYKELSDLCKVHHLSYLDQIVITVTDYAKTIQPNRLVNYFVEYFNRKTEWELILSKIESENEGKKSKI